MKDAQESEPVQGAAPAQAEAPKKPRGVPLHWSRPYLASWLFHGVLVTLAAWYWVESRPLKVRGERGIATIEIAHEPDRVLPPEPEDQEPPPEVEQPLVHEEPELMESPEDEPEFTPEEAFTPEALDWLPPKDLFAEVTPFKRKPKPKVERAPPKPEPKPEPVPVEPTVPTFLEGADLPEVLKKETPAYPRKAVRLHWEGTVMLRIRVDATGKVIDVTVHESSGYEALDQAAVAAFQNWLFEPRGPDDPLIRLLQKPFTFQLN